MSDVILKLNGYLWGLPMIAFLLFIHIFMAVKTRGIQKKTLLGLRLSVTPRRGEKGGLTPFQALSTSLAQTLGTGNIIGVGTAVAMGGAGAVFWCWITGILGMATQYAEVLLSVKYRTKNSRGEYTGGPMYVLRDALKSKKLGMVYAVLAASASVITGAIIQSNSIAEVIEETMGKGNRQIGVPGLDVSLSSLLVGVVLSIFTAVVIFGGITFIGKICQVMVPFMAIVFMLSCAMVLYINRAVLIDTVKLIMVSAFSSRSAGGGFVGSTILTACRYGVARGLFSNEAGLGTSSIVSASANTSSPVRQALVSMTATFWDTVVMCLVTGLCIVSSIISTSEGATAVVDGGVACYLAFSQIPFIGEGILVFSLFFFAFSTIIGLSCVGMSCAGFVFGSNACKPYCVIWVLSVLAAPLISSEVLWSVADICNSLLAIPNIYALVMLSGVVRDETDKYMKGLPAKHRKKHI